MNQFVSRISKINNFVDRKAGSLFEPCGAKRLNAICTEAKARITIVIHIVRLESCG